MRYLILLALAVGSLAALEDPRARLLAIDEAADAQRLAYLKEWLAGANLDPVPVPAAAPKNTKEELETNRVKRMNVALAAARKIRETGEGYLYLTQATQYRPILEAQVGRAAPQPRAAAEAGHKPPSGGIVSPEPAAPEGSR